MSILIEGLTKEDFFRILLAARCGLFQKGECDSYYGHKVKEIPPHGRLIDADALEEYCKRQAGDKWNQKAGTFWSYAFEEFEDIVRDRETIIEAEEVKE